MSLNKLLVVLLVNLVILSAGPPVPFVALVLKNFSKTHGLKWVQVNPSEVSESKVSSGEPL